MSHVSTQETSLSDTDPEEIGPRTPLISSPSKFPVERGVNSEASTEVIDNNSEDEDDSKSDQKSDSDDDESQNHHTPLINSSTKHKQLKSSKLRRSKGKNKKEEQKTESDDDTEDEDEESAVDRIHKLRTLTEQTMITQASKKPVTIYMGGKEQRIAKVVKEQRLMFRSKQKPFFVSLKHVTYSVKITTAKAFQVNNLNSLPPLRLFNKYVLRNDKTVPWPILKDLNLYFKPGTMTLLLGPPGSGKSSLLQMLADRLGASDVNITGDMLFNGLPASKKHHHRDVAFLSQSDEIHIPQLTVRETFRFAVYCQMPQGVPAYIKEQRVDIMLQLMGLANRADTVVGDELLRGVSGGEKRRVSLGVECLTKMPSFIALDEPTTGLDAAAALDLVRFFKSLAASTGAPIVMALLQPSYEIFCLFDKVALLSKGEVAYFGDRIKALKFYEDRGYICDLVTNPAEFLQEVIENPEKFRRTEKEVQKDADNAERAMKEAKEEEKKDKDGKKHGKKHGKDKVDKSDEEEIESDEEENGHNGKDKSNHKKKGHKDLNRSSGKKGKDEEYDRDRFIKEWREENIKDIIHTINVENAKITEEEPENDEEDLEKGNAKDNTDKASGHGVFAAFSPSKRREKKEIEARRKKVFSYTDEYEYPATFITQFMFLLYRSWLTLIRDKDVFQVRLFRSSIMALVFGTLFLKLSHNQTDGVRTKPSYIYFMETFIAFGSLAYLPAFFKEKRVYYYQRRARYYRVLPYYLASVIVDIPIQLLEVVLFGTITYWLAAMDNDAGKFFFWLFLLLIIQNLMKTVMKLCGIILQNPSNASSAAALLVFLLVLFSGFSVPKMQIGNWFIWLYWISPFQWAYQAAIINEYAGETSYYCNEDELFPLRNTYYYNQPYPKGTGGAQICQFTTGDQILGNRFGFWTDLNYRWICLAIMIAYDILSHILSYFCLVLLNPKQPRFRIGGFGRNPVKAAKSKGDNQQGGESNEAQSGGYAEDGTGGVPDDYDEYMSKDGQGDEYLEENDREERESKGGAGGKKNKAKAGNKKEAKSALGKDVKKADKMKKSGRAPVGVSPDFDADNSRAGYLVFTDLSYSVKAGGSNPIVRFINSIKGWILSKRPGAKDDDDKKKDGEKDSKENEDDSDSEGSSKGKKHNKGDKEGGSNNKKKEKTKDVKGRITLLYDINGYVAPGQMLALMGASGAGKTTLLDVLGLRKTSGTIKGNMELNGTSMSKRTNRYIGYVEQRDIHILTATVEEAITYSALLRLPSKGWFSRSKKETDKKHGSNNNKNQQESDEEDETDSEESDSNEDSDGSENGTEMKERSQNKQRNVNKSSGKHKKSVKIQKRTRKEKLQLVEDLLDILELQQLRKRLVVMLSPEQKKRLTIGVEMAADPVVLFLDEPTSGLDSRGAEVVMRVVRQIVDSGRASVICTIHQPSSTVFALFTHLLLLKRGGKQIYFGPIHAENKKEKKAGGLGGKFGAVLAYFGKLGLKCEPHRNPADWVLDVSGAGIGREQMVGKEEAKAKKWQILKRLKHKRRMDKNLKGEEKTQSLREDLGIDPPDLENNSGDLDDPKVLKKNLAAVNYVRDVEDHTVRDGENILDTDKSDEGESDKDLDDAKDEEVEDPDFADQMEKREKQNLEKSKKVDLVEAFEKSKRYDDMMNFIEEHKPQGKKESKIKRFLMSAKNSYAVGFWPQFYYSIKRSIITTWRDPISTRTRIFRAIFLGLIIGFLYYDLDRGSADMQLRIGLIFFMIIFTLLNSIPSVPKIMMERSVFYRERASMTYRSLVYLGVLVLEDFPFMLLSVITFILPIYFLGNLQYNAGKFFFFAFAFTLVYLCSFGWVQFVSILSPSLGSANALLGVTLPITLVFCGFLRTRTVIPRYWIWAHYLSFFTYIIESVNINELKLQPVYCSFGELIPVPVSVNGTMQLARVCPFKTGSDILDQFDLEPKMKWPDLAILFGFYIVFVLGAWFGLKFVKNIKR